MSDNSINTVPTYDNVPEDLIPRVPVAPKTQATYKRALARIPGGVQLLSKRPEQYVPGVWPGYFAEAKGCEVYDLDGNHYYDMTTNGIMTCVLGFADQDVNAAVKRRIDRGNMCSLNPPEEVELAERLCSLHPWAEEVRFARTGGETTTVAVRIARATTGRDVVAICGYHGWHDWYLSAALPSEDKLNGHLFGLNPYGVPKVLNGSTVTFRHNDFESFDNMLREYGDRLACVIMEPFRNELPLPGFLEHVRDAVHKVGGLLIFDEITIGWRLCFGGVHLKVKVNPDIATFAKALGNGYPIGAVIGNSAAMAGAHRSFISSTYWTESIGPTAALATLDKMEQTRAWERVSQAGEEVLAVWEEAANKHRVPITLMKENVSMPKFSFDNDGNKMKTLYTLYMIEEGFLANNAFIPTLAHTPEILSLHAKAVHNTFAKLKRAADAGLIDILTAGREAQVGFGRLVK